MTEVNECCTKCGGKNIEPLDGNDWECYDCGITFNKPMEKSKDEAINTK